MGDDELEALCSEIDRASDRTKRLLDDGASDQEIAAKVSPSVRPVHNLLPAFQTPCLCGSVRDRTQFRVRFRS